MRVLAVAIALIIAGAINLFAIKFGMEDERPLVRLFAVAAGSIAIICAIAIPGAALRFLLTPESLQLTRFFAATAATCTAVSFVLDIAIAVRLRRAAA